MSLSSRASRIGRRRSGWRSWLLAVVGWLASLAAQGNAAEVKLRWTNPSYNALRDSCADDSTSPLLDLYRLELFGTRVPQGDRASIGFIPANGMAGREDSCVVDLADSVHYVSFTIETEDGSGNRPSCGAQVLVAIEARDWLPGLQATYYDNENLTGQFAKRVDPAIAFTWGLGAPIPGMGVDTFSEHWEGQINLPVSGVWSLSAIVEDGWRAWVGGVYVANDFGVQNVHESQCQFNAQAGWTQIIVEAMHHNGNAQMTLSWTPPGGIKAIVPSSSLRH